MDYSYHKAERAKERGKIIKSLIPRFLLLLRKQKDYKRRFPSSFIDVDSSVAQGTKIGRRCVIRERCSIGANVEMGNCTTLGPSSTMNGKGRISIGNFCSIAPECLFWSENHILSNVSTFPFEQFKEGVEKNYQEYTGEDITIGNDVWIGQRATILAGADIGDGCVIAAGSVVPRGTYEPYSVIAGVPGKVIKKRLSEDKIEELLKMKWWDKPDDEIFGELMPFLHQGEQKS